MAGRALVRLTEGQSGAATFRIANAPLYLKWGSGPAAELVGDEIARLRWLGGRLGAPGLVAVVEHDGEAWLLTEAVPGMTVGEYLSRYRDRTSAVASEIAAFVHRVQGLPAVSCPFDSTLATWLPMARGLVAAGLVDTDDFDDEHAGWTAERVLAKVELLAGHERSRTVVHGDLSMGNLLIDANGLITGCIDVGLLGVGDPYRDIFIAWRDLGGWGRPAQRALLDALGLAELDPHRRDLHRALDELF